MKYRINETNLKRADIKEIKREEAEERQSAYNDLTFDQKAERNSTKWAKKTECLEGE